MIETLLDDRRVVDAICSNERKEINQVFHQMYRDYFPGIRSFVVTNGGSENDAADVFQESLALFFIQIKLERFRGECGLKTYLFGIARNTWLKACTLKSRQVVDFHLDDCNDWPSSDPYHEIKMRLQRIIQELPDNCGEILLDFYFGGLTMNEIRDKYGLGSTQAAKNKKLRSMKRLINQISKQGITAEAFCY